MFSPFKQNLSSTLKVLQATNPPPHTFPKEKKKNSKQIYRQTYLLPLFPYT
jgi:hypothetical protein